MVLRAKRASAAVHFRGWGQDHPCKGTSGADINHTQRVQTRMYHTFHHSLHHRHTLARREDSHPQRENQWQVLERRWLYLGADLSSRGSIPFIDSSAASTIPLCAGASLYTQRSHGLETWGHAVRSGRGDCMDVIGTAVDCPSGKGCYVISLSVRWMKPKHAEARSLDHDSPCSSFSSLAGLPTQCYTSRCDNPGSRCIRATAHHGDFDVRQPLERSAAFKPEASSFR